MKYADVVIDNNTDATDLCYTYACEDGDDPLLQVGRKVKIPFGVHNKSIDGYITALHGELPEGMNGKKLKKISLLDILAFPNGILVH